MVVIRNKNCYTNFFTCRLCTVGDRWPRTCKEQVSARKSHFLKLEIEESILSKFCLQQIKKKKGYLIWLNDIYFAKNLTNNQRRKKYLVWLTPVLISIVVSALFFLQRHHHDHQHHHYHDHQHRHHHHHHHHIFIFSSLVPIKIAPFSSKFHWTNFVFF